MTQRQRPLLAIIYALVSTQTWWLTEGSHTSPSCHPWSLKIPSEVRDRPHKSIIAHRGASFHLPEHTLAAYRLALELSADWIEPDLVSTSDGVLIAMHTLDLSITTDVVTVFPNRDPWFSPRMNRTGYWTFNFTFDEIQKLTTRQRLPAARSTRFDGEFGVPSLTEILQVVNDWNKNDLLLLTNASTERESPGHPAPIELQYAGVYAELKDASWLREEANIDLVDLLYRHMEEYDDLWKDLMPCYIGMRHDEYRVPGLVIQSFEAEVLSNFHERWRQTFNALLGNERPEPPSVLLVNKDVCSSSRFWEDVTDKYRGFLDGIGCEKSCVGQKEDVTTIQSKELELVIHAWTLRPELSELMSGFGSIMDETEHLLCTIGVSAVFSESVNHASIVAQRGCPTPAGSGGSSADGTLDEHSCDAKHSTNTAIRIICFVMGLTISAVGACVVVGKKRSPLPNQSGHQVPVVVIDEEDEHELELM